MDIQAFLKQTDVYFVGSEADDSVLVAISPGFDFPSCMVTWWDTSHERRKMVHKLIGIDHGVLHFIDDRGADYRFVPMTLQLYNSIVRHHMLNKEPFTNEKEMLDALRSSTRIYY